MDDIEKLPFSDLIKVMVSYRETGDALAYRIACEELDRRMGVLTRAADFMDTAARECGHDD